MAVPSLPIARSSSATSGTSARSATAMRFDSGINGRATNASNTSNGLMRGRRGSAPQSFPAKRSETKTRELHQNFTQLRGQGGRVGHEMRGLELRLGAPIRDL